VQRRLRASPPKERAPPASYGRATRRCARLIRSAATTATTPDTHVSNKAGATTPAMSPSSPIFPRARTIKVRIPATSKTPTAVAASSGVLDGLRERCGRQSSQKEHRLHAALKSTLYQKEVTCQAAFFRRGPLMLESNSRPRNAEVGPHPKSVEQRVMGDLFQDNSSLTAKGRSTLGDFPFLIQN